MDGLTLVFDLDGTLVDTAPDLAGATNHALAEAGFDAVPAALLRPWVSYGARRMIVEALASHGASLAEPAVDRLLERFLSYYEANIARDSRPFPGSIEVIAGLRSAGARLAICTNKREQLSRALLEALEIQHLFHGVAGRDTFPVSKPHPDHVLGAIRLAGGEASRAIMIGDSQVDIEAAHAAGVPVVACSFGYSETPVDRLGPEAVIGHYHELTEVLGRLLPSPAARP